MMKTDKDHMHERSFGGHGRAHALRHAEDRRGEHREWPSRSGRRDQAGQHGHDGRLGSSDRHAGSSGPEKTFDGGHGQHGSRRGPEDRPGGERSGRGFGGRGDVRAATLTLLAEQPLHGYEIIQQITERSGGAWRPSPGSVYPALQLLEDQGLVQSDQTEGRRVYQLTEAGRTYIEQHREELAEVWASVTVAGDDPARGLHDLFDQLGGAVRQVVQAGTEAQIAAASDVLMSVRRQLYRILADDPVEGTPPDTGRS